MIIQHLNPTGRVHIRLTSGQCLAHRHEVLGGRSLLLWCAFAQTLYCVERTLQKQQQGICQSFHKQNLCQRFVLLNIYKPDLSLLSHLWCVLRTLQGMKI